MNKKQTKNSQIQKTEWWLPEGGGEDTEGKWGHRCGGGRRPDSGCITELYTST